MTTEPDEEYERGTQSGRGWAEHSTDQEAMDQIEAIDLTDAGAFDSALRVYMRCIDPDGNSAQDGIFDASGAEGRSMTRSYLFGFVDGARGMMREMKARGHA